MLFLLTSHSYPPSPVGFLCSHMSVPNSVPVRLFCACRFTCVLAAALPSMGAAPLGAHDAWVGRVGNGDIREACWVKQAAEQGHRLSTFRVLGPLGGWCLAPKAASCWHTSPLCLWEGTSFRAEPGATQDRDCLLGGPHLDQMQLPRRSKFIPVLPSSCHSGGSCLVPGTV